MTTAHEQEAPGVVEDVFDGLATGVEVEGDGGADAAIVRPWDPASIRVTTNQFSLRNILDMIDEGSLELAPDFQRGQVWKIDQKSRLVESVLLQIPLPAFYFAEDSDGAFRVVDGLQRLSTLHAFVRGGEQGFRLKGLEYLRENDKGFADLPVQWQRRIFNTQLVVNVIDPTTPPDVMYDIFKRINTGGTPLNAQEIRHCMSRKRSRDILKIMTSMVEFNTATNGMGGHIRMNDREMALRFAAFWLLGMDAYMERPAMDSFLERATRLLDNEKEVPDERVIELYEAFRAAMSNAHLLFGEYTFRKWPEGVTWRNPINRALFETWSIALAPYDPADLEGRRTAIVAAARRRMSRDIDYLDAITSSTSDRRRVDYRFRAAAEDAKAGA
ncbi:DUF262 domain-containing protein [Streptomyces flaveus]|uniref:GmrSD restriction endonucleases N-terminal domain-containing protein n=1 Tax=Streptomyces flaveus TaxID=66370 RepID=A0A917QXA8_9ACTN|nr:DUF262 domain-containing protein [Streptomyces flaveus]GGK73323.1 hypothetical protein GCM10010094_37990 [Streptomyces flaveus]